jgi:hypothetical protein
MITFTQLTEGITKPVPMGVIVKAMEPARSKIVGKSIKPQNIIKVVEKTIGKKFGLRTTLEYAAGLDSGELSANAYYDQEDEIEGDPPVHIEFLFSSKDKKGIDIDGAGFDELSTQVAKVVVHELLHKSQADARKFVKTKPFKVRAAFSPQQAKNQEYLGNSDEIDAYGHNIAVELLKNYGSRKNSLTALRNFVRIPHNKSPDMFAYLVAFGMDKNHPVLKKLVKKIILFLKELDK